MNKKKQASNSTGSEKKTNIVNVNGFKMHLTEIEIALNDHDKSKDKDLINPDDVYNKTIEDL